MPINPAAPEAQQPSARLAQEIADLKREIALLQRTGLPEVEGWQAPSLQNSWTNYGSPHASAGYCIDLMGFVHLRGVVKSGTIGAAIFTLPNGYWPSGQLLLPVISNGAIGRVDINSSGVVTATAGSNTYVSLDGIVFRKSV